MNPFDGVIELVAVGDTQGFSSAAKRLGVSTSQVSRKIAALEARLGTALVARTTRQVKLTSAGLAYYQRCVELTNGLDEADQLLTQDTVKLSGVLRISAAGEFAVNYIAPALMAFSDQHPDLSIDVDFNSRMVNFVEENIDFAIRYGHLEDSDLIARKLVDRKLIAAASPSYLKKYGTPQHPQALAQHQCIVANNDHWHFDLDGDTHKVRVKGRWKSNNAACVVQACQSGLGIAYLPRSSFGDALNNGSLTPILEPFWYSGITSWIVYANRRYLPIRARLAIDFLLNHFKTWQE